MSGFRTQPGFSPSGLHAAHQQAIAETLAQPLPPRRLRTNPASSNTRCAARTSNGPNTEAGPNPPGRPTNQITVLAAQVTRIASNTFAA